MQPYLNAGPRVYTAKKEGRSMNFSNPGKMERQQPQAICIQSRTEEKFTPTSNPLEHSVKKVCLSC